jgi:hypothetical protein
VKRAGNRIRNLFIVGYSISLSVYSTKLSLYEPAYLALQPVVPEQVGILRALGKKQHPGQTIPGASPRKSPRIIRHRSLLCFTKRRVPAGFISLKRVNGGTYAAFSGEIAGEE